MPRIVEKKGGQKTTRAGFTIIEVIVVIVVLGFGIITLTSIFSTIQTTQRSAFYMSVATHAARTEIERLRSSGYASIRSGNTYPFAQLPASLPVGSTGTVTVSAPANALSSKQVDAVVTYTVGSLQKQVAISAYIDPPKVTGP